MVILGFAYVLSSGDNLIVSTVWPTKKELIDNEDWINDATSNGYLIAEMTINVPDEVVRVLEASTNLIEGDITAFEVVDAE